MSRSLRFAAVILSAVAAGPASANQQTDVSPDAAATVAAVANDARSEAAQESEQDAGAAPAQPESGAATAKPAAPAPPPKPTLTASIDLAQQRMTVFENGVAKYSWSISSGAAGHATPRGTFRPQWTAKMWNSRKYDWAPMPHSVFIHGGIAVHGTQHLGALGSPASKGCIRLAPGNARTFYNLVHRHGLKRTKVSIHGTPKFRAPAVASRRKKPAPQYAESGSWFWDSPSASAYNPNFVRNKARKPELRAYRKRGSNKIIYLRQPPPSYYAGGW